MWLPQQSQLDQVNSPADIQTGSSAAFPQDKHQVTDTAGCIWSLHDDFCNDEPLWRFSIILSTKTREYDCRWQLLQLPSQRKSCQIAHTLVFPSPLSKAGSWQEPAGMEESSPPSLSSFQMVCLDWEFSHHSLHQPKGKVRYSLR